MDYVGPFTSRSKQQETEHLNKQSFYWFPLCVDTRQTSKTTGVLLACCSGQGASVSIWMAFLMPEVIGFSKHYSYIYIKL